MKRFSTIIAALALGSTLGMGCKDRSEPEDRELSRARQELDEAKQKASDELEEARRGASEAIDEAERELSEGRERMAEYTYADRNEFRSERERELVELDVQISELEEQARDAKGEAKHDLDATVEDLRRGRDQVRMELDRFGDVTENDWEAFRQSVDDAMYGLKNDIRVAWDRFKRST